MDYKTSRGFIMKIFDNRLNISIMRTLITTLLLALLVVGCNDFGDLNQDPNNPDQPRPELLMTEAERSIGDVITQVTPTLYVQYFSEVYYTDASLYSTTTFNFSSWYYGPLNNLQTIIDLNTDEETMNEGYVTAGGSTDNQIATARILRAYFFHFLTDRWGMIPYTDALQGEENQTPSYDTQQDIYADLLNELNEAADQINPGQTGPTGDFLFEGDMERWRTFANSLRMRVALRMADVEPGTAESEFVDAYNAGMIEEDVMFQFGADETNENPWYSAFETRIDYAASETLVDTMQAFNDLRLTHYAADASNPGPWEATGEPEMEDIEGFPYGLAQSDAGEIDNTSRSLPNLRVIQQDAALPIITLAELNFSLAEAAERGWAVDGTAEEFYENGIQASWQQWDVFAENEDTFEAYLTEDEVVYDSAEWEQRIGYQKWVALFPLGYEAWAEWRRLDYPQLEPAPAALNASGEIPVRHAYPTSETELNAENYEVAVEQQGPDILDTDLWWDVE